MSETQHTPGPWKFLPSFGRIEVEKFIVAYLSLSVEGRANPLYLSQGEAEANGKLIAAAPELLEALEGLLDYLRIFWPDEPLFSKDDNKQSHDIYNAEAAIRKARGE